MRKAREIAIKRKANDLNGSDWTKYSISLWSDIRKSPEEIRLGHPALFPEMLVERLLKAYTRSDQKLVLDPFAGSGSTLVAAYKMGKTGIGFEVNYDFIKLAEKRLAQLSFEFGDSRKIEPLIFQEDAREIDKFVYKPIDICITSPPYWNILSQKRTADGKENRDYGPGAKDLGKIQSYEGFLKELDLVWEKVYSILKCQAYLIINVMDIRKKDKFYPFHMDLIEHICKIGNPTYFLDDIIIWDRRQEYNNLRPLGYPYKFRINKVHEYLFIFQKP